MTYFILRVYQNEATKQKLVNIPKDSKIKAKDYIIVKKVDGETIKRLVEDGKV